MGKDKLSNIQKETESPPAKIKLHKKDKVCTQRVWGKVTVTQVYFGKKTNANIRKSFEKSLNSKNNETLILQQRDLRQRQQEIKRKKGDKEIRQATKNNNETNCKEMGKQIQTLTSELNHTKLILQRNENTSSLTPKNAVNSSL